MSILKALTNNQLLNRLHDLIQRDQVLETELIAHLGEVDARRLYLGQACPSMFHYCVHLLHFAEGVAYKRIAVARAARQFPDLLAALEGGELHLTGASLIAPHLGGGEVEEWLAIARHATAREIRQRIADRKPRPDLKTSVRRSRLAVKPDDPTAARKRVVALEAIAASAVAVAADVATNGDAAVGAAANPNAAANPPTLRPAHATAISSSTPPSQPVRSATPGLIRTPSSTRTKARSEPLGAERYCIRFVADQAVYEQLEELRSLMRHSIPDGDLAKILARAVGVLLEQVRKQKIGACASPRLARSPQASKPSPATAPDGAAPKAGDPSRHIPLAIRRAVWARDAGRCCYRSREGRQCGSQAYLEFHHQLPWARRREHELSNISLRCRAHNQYEAELAFGAPHRTPFRNRAPACTAAKGPIPESLEVPGSNWI